MFIKWKSIVAFFLLLALTMGAAVADEDEEKKDDAPKDPRADIQVESIDTPEGLHPGQGNKVKVRILNRSKDNHIEVPIKVRLVVIPKNGERTTHELQLEKLERDRKEDLVFESIELFEAQPVRILVIADPEHLIDETNENNNRRIFSAPVMQPAAPKAEGEQQAKNDQN